MKTIQDQLIKMVAERGLRKAAGELGIDHGQLYRHIHSDLKLSTLQFILKHFGCELKIVKRKEVKSK